MPGILIPILGLIFWFVYTMVRQKQKFELEKLDRMGKVASVSSAGEDEDASLTTTELESMIQAAVERANQPIVDRVDAIERRLSLDFDEPAPSSEAPPKTVGRTRA